MIHLQHKLNVTFSVRTINFIQFHRQLCAMGFRRKRDGIQLAHRQRTKPCIIRLLNIQYSLFKFAHRTIVSETMESMVHQMFQNDQEKKRIMSILKPTIIQDRLTKLYTTFPL